MAINIDFKEFMSDLPVIEEASIYKPGKTFEFQPKGLYSEQIFGPIKNYACACKEGGIQSVLNKGVRCPECGVLCETDKLRSSQFAKIELPCHVILPPFIKNLYKIFGQASIKSIMDKAKRQDNEKSPYYYPKENFNQSETKLMKINEKTKQLVYLDYPVYDITTLYNLFTYLKDETEELNYIKYNKFLDYIFMDSILVLPINNRPVIKITDEKQNVHPLTMQYVKILKTRTNSIMDSLAQKNSPVHGGNVYRYQTLVNELYDILLQKNFQQKESISRDYMMGKNIEHSGRLVIVPNPILKPYQIGLPAKTIKDINFLELAYYQTEMISKQSADSSMITTFAKNSINVFNAGESINISDTEFHNFIKSKKADLVYVCERAPVLWKYNVTAFTLGFYTNDHEDAKRKMKPTKTTKFNYRLKNRTTSKED